MNRKYSGFTLVEMLIVMGIIIILMAVGITAGRFAINRANDVAHQDAADKLFVAAQAYMTDFREYPEVTDWGSALANDVACGDPCLEEYLSAGEFEGGTDTTFYYWTDTKSAVVCVSLGGVGDEDERGYYCTGNGINATVPSTAGIDSKDIDADVPTDGFPGTSTAATWMSIQDWSNETNDFGNNTGTYTN